MSQRTLRLIEKNEDVFRTRPKPPTETFDFGLFAQPAPPADAPSLYWRSRYAELAADCDHGAKLLELAEPVMRAILHAFKSGTVWEVRYTLGVMGKLANDGKEELDAFGALGLRMGLIAVDTERPAPWAMKELGVSHGNRGSVWSLPEHAESYDRKARRRRLKQEHAEAAA